MNDESERAKINERSRQNLDYGALGQKQERWGEKDASLA